MVDRIQSWRGKAGIFAFVVAAVVAGAWVKSEIDDVVEHWSFGGREWAQRLAGKICVYYNRGFVEHPGYLPQTQWHIAGLYSKAEIQYAPLQVVETRPHTIGANNGPIPRYDGPTDTPIFYERFGFCVAREDGEYGDQGLSVLVPHWAVVLPMLLMSAVLLAPARNVRWASSEANSGLSSRPGPAHAAPNPKRRAPRRWKRGLAAGCAAALLVVGWIRSSATTDRFRFIFGPSQMIELASAKEGLAFRQQHIDWDDGFQTAYRKLTGKDHQTLTFRPLGWELRDSPPEFNVDTGEMFNPIRPFAEGDIPVDGGIQQVAFEQATPETNINRAGAGIVTDATQFNPIRPFAESAFPVEEEVEQATSEPSGGRDWAGIMVDWLGGYFSLSRDPIGLTIVVPYWMMAAGFALITCFMLRRRLVAEGRRCVGPGQAAG